MENDRLRGYIIQKFGISGDDYDTARNSLGDVDIGRQLEVLEGAAVLKERYGSQNYLQNTLLIKRMGIKSARMILEDARRKGTDIGKLVELMAQPMSDLGHEALDHQLFGGVYRDERGNSRDDPMPKVTGGVEVIYPDPGNEREQRLFSSSDPVETLPRRFAYIQK